MKTFIKFIIGAVLLIATTSCSESWDRTIKDMKSDYGGGLYRRVTVYDYQGKCYQILGGKV